MEIRLSLMSESGQLMCQQVTRPQREGDDREPYQVTEP